MNASSGHDLMSVLHLTSKDTSLALALFYVSYVIFDFPSNLVMSRLSPRVWMARIVFAVGVIGTCFTAVRSAWSVKFLRFLLGIVIAGMWPGMAYYLTLFYPPSRTGKRIGMYFTASQLSAAVVGLVSAGFQLMDGTGGLVGFRWMFLLYGLVTMTATWASSSYSAGTAQVAEYFHVGRQTATPGTTHDSGLSSLGQLAKRAESG